MGRRGLPKRRILIVENSEPIRRDLKAFLESYGPYSVVGEAPSLGKAMGAVWDLEPEIVLANIDLPDGDRLGTVRLLSSMAPSAALVMVGPSDADEYASAVREAGATAVIAKHRLFDSLMPALEIASQKAKNHGANGHNGLNGHHASNNGYHARERFEAQPIDLPMHLWWKPRGWREWLAGAATFGWALFRGAPIDSAPERSYWRHVEAAMIVLVVMLAVSLIGGSFGQTDNLSRALILVALMILAVAEVRQIRRLSSVKRSSEEQRPN